MARFILLTMGLCSALFIGCGGSSEGPWGLDEKPEKSTPEAAAPEAPPAETTEGDK